MVRIGFVGSGGIAGHHMRQLVTLENAKMVAFCDIDSSRAENAAKEYEGTAYTSYKEMYDQEDLDAVYICLPPFAHTDQELLAIEKGLAIFVEKPIATMVAKAEEIAQSIDLSKIRHRTIHFLNPIQTFIHSSLPPLDRYFLEDTLGSTYAISPRH